MIHVISFSYRDNMVPTSNPDCNLSVYDCRKLRNPYHYEPLRTLNGHHSTVRKYVANDRVNVILMLEYALSDVRAHIATFNNTDYTVAFGCTGGQHRSVSMAIMFNEILATLFIPTEIEHRNL